VLERNGEPGEMVRSEGESERARETNTERQRDIETKRDRERLSRTDKEERDYLPGVHQLRLSSIL